MKDYSELLIDAGSEARFNKLLRTSLKKNRLVIDKQLSEDYYNISNGSGVLGFDTSILKYSYGKAKSQKVIDEFIEKVLLDFEILERMVSFTNGQEFLRFTIMQAIDIKEGMIYDNFIGDMKRVVCYTSNGKNARPIYEDCLVKWDVPREVVFSVADRNMCRMLKKASANKESFTLNYNHINSVEFNDENSEIISAFMVCSDFLDYATPILSSNFLAVSPSKDTLILLSDIDKRLHKESLVQLKDVVTKEYSWATYPLTTEILRYTIKGVEAIQI